jgi:hypothetical protein
VLEAFVKVKIWWWFLDVRRILKGKFWMWFLDVRSISECKILEALLRCNKHL